MKRDAPAATQVDGPFVLPPLPFPQRALAPVISARTVRFHYGQHHKGYVDKLNSLVAEHHIQELPLVELIRRTHDRADQVEIFNNAAQVWNHNFYWQCIAPPGGSDRRAEGDLARLVKTHFGSHDALRSELVKSALKQFGNGWVWLVRGPEGLSVMTTGNAEVPFTSGHSPLINIDIWEHAYYLDYQNRREEHVTAVVDKLLNWRFAAENLKRTEAMTSDSPAMASVT